MSGDAFLSLFDKADGESIQKGKEKWIEVRRWEWGIDAETSWTKGGGASVGKPDPGRITWEHAFDTASTVIMGYICTGKAFPKAELQVRKSTDKGAETYFMMTMEGVFVTRVQNGGTEAGDVTQTVEMVFKTVKIEYKPLDPKTGKLGALKAYSWDIPAGTASP